MEAFVDVYGVRKIDWIQYLIQKLHLKTNISGSAESIEKNKNKK